MYRLGDKVRVQVVMSGHGTATDRSGIADILERVRRDERSRGPHRSAVAPKKSSTGVRSGERRKAQRPPARATGEEGPRIGPRPSPLGLLGGLGGLRATVLRRVLEIPDAPADAAADLGQAVGAEDQDDDRQNDD